MFHSQEIKVTLDAESAAATSDVNGTALDMAGFEGVIFMVKVATAASGNFIQAQGGATSSPTTDLAGTKVISGSNGDVLVLDVNKPKDRYIRPVVKRGTSTALGSLIAIQYGGRTGAEVNGNVRKLVQTPADGTP